MLTEDRVKEIIKNGVSKELSKAQEMTERLNMHITGKGLEEYLEKLEDYENEHQRKLRLKLLKSNKALFSFLLRPLDKVFSAKGGYIAYNLSESKIKELKDFTSDVSDGLDIKTYLHKKILKKYIIDPNGFVMVDIDTESNMESVFYSCRDVIYYKRRGNELKEIVFAPYKNPNNDKDTKEYYRVIDDFTDSIYVKDGDVVTLDETSVIQNFFKSVPAFMLGDTYDPNSNNFLSVIDEVVEDAEERLRDVSIKTVHKLSHGYAKYWQYPESCTKCGGDGEIKTKVDDVVTTTVCGSCQGGGVKQRKDPSDVMLLDIPNGDETKVAPDVGGYINPSIEIWDQYNKEVLEIRNAMFQTLWGTTYTTESTNETATGRFLDEQPVQDRLNPISKTFSNIHNFLINYFGKASLQNPSYEATVSYGTKYPIETPDASLDRFIKASEKNLPPILQKDLLENYYQNEHSSNDIEFQKKKKILSVDPFPFMSANEVKALGVDETDLKCKVYLSQWASQIEEAKLVLMTQEELKNDLIKYVTSKTISNEVQQKEEK